MKLKQLNLIRRLKAFLRMTLGRRWLNNTAAMIKALIYGIFSIVVTFSISYIVTGDTVTSLGISALDFIGKTIMYYVFEISWENFKKRI